MNPVTLHLAVLYYCYCVLSLHNAHTQRAAERSADLTADRTTGRVVDRATQTPILLRAPRKAFSVT